MSTLRAVPDQSLTDRVAEEVRVQMARVRMTQTRLAEVVGLPQSAISNRLRGKVPFTTDDLEKVADALGVHPAQLLGGTAGGDGPGTPTTTTGRYSPSEITDSSSLTTTLVGPATQRPARVAA